MILEQRLPSNEYTELHKMLVMHKGLPRHIVRKKIIDPTQSAAYFNEVEALKSIDHERIPRLISYDDDNLEICMKYIYGADLDKVCLSYDQSIKVLARTAVIIDDIHKKGFLHNDIKSANIFLDLVVEPYVIDFGMSDRVLNPKIHHGTILYTAPEAFASPRTTATDVFSLGVVAYKQFTGSFPFGEDESVILLNYFQGKLKKPKLANTMSGLICSALETLPENRPTMQEFSTILNEQQS